MAAVRRYRWTTGYVAAVYATTAAAIVAWHFVAVV